MNQRKLGRTKGLDVSAIGLGCMGMSPDFYGPTDDEIGIATIKAAVDAGITLLDTGEYYGMGHNEMLIGKTLKDIPRDKVVISVKFGAQRDPDGNWLGYDCRPNAVKNSLAHTLRRLNTDYIDIYRPGRLDPSVPIEETIGAISEMIKAGYVRYVGLSEVGSKTIRRAHKIHPVTDLQIEYSLISRGIEKDILPTCRELGVGITAYGVLSRGLISGHWSKTRQTGPKDFRSRGPRFTDENLDKNLALVETLRKIADDKGCTVAQIAIAWVLSRGEDIVPLVGSRRKEQLDEALKALDVVLAPEDLVSVEKAVPQGAAAGDRYPAYAMSMLDSEKA